MKVMQVLPELNSGGVERGTLEVADFLVKQGHEALVVSNGGRQVEKLEESGARHIAMPVHRKSLSSLFQVRPFRKLLEQEKPDILHIRSRVPGWIAYLAWRKMDKTTRPRLVSTVHGFYSVNRYSAVMTKGERVSPVDVFWFQDRWKMYLSEEKGPSGWLGSAEARSSRHPHRALVWLPACPQDWTLSEKWQHPDVMYEFAKESGTSTPAWLPEQAVLHEVSTMKSISDRQREIARIDASAALPLDFVIAGCHDNSLRRAARREAIQFFSTAS